MNTLTTLFAAGLLATSATAQTQADAGGTPSHFPHSDDFSYHENEDGSIVTADTEGTYFFQNHQQYLTSAFFQKHGLRCGNEILSHPLSAFRVASDCTNGVTNPAAQYDPQGGDTYEIQVVWHILTRNNGAGDVSDALIDAQMATLNADFAGSGISFTKAGTTRSRSNSWYNDSGTYYNSLSWDTTKYLNIYTNTAGGNLGYAYVPNGGGIVGSSFDRVVMYWPAIGGASLPAPYGPPYHLGKTLVHEVGHYLGLYHTFQGGCAAGSAPGCYSSGDLICDTNSEASANFSPCSRTTCGTPDPTNNYMDYSDDVCMDEFTGEQINRMRCTLANYRVDLDGGGVTPPSGPGKATNPFPANGARNQPRNLTLSWGAGSGATSYEVWFGTSSSNLSQIGTPSGTSLSVSGLGSRTRYYWRVDSVNGDGTTTGDVWNFRTARN